MVTAQRQIYLARYTEIDPESRHYLQEVIRPVSNEGWTKEGYRINRWALVLAAGLVEAKRKFLAGECQWFS